MVLSGSICKNALGTKPPSATAIGSGPGVEHPVKEKPITTPPPKTAVAFKNPRRETFSIFIRYASCAKAAFRNSGWAELAARTAFLMRG